MKYLIAICFLCGALQAKENMNTTSINQLTQNDAIESIVKDEIFSKCLDLFHQTFDNLDQVVFSSKIDGSLVSNIELEIEKSIGKYLQQATPWAAFLGEEGVRFDAPDGSLGYKWFLDPIDGTISFCNGLDTFAFTLTLSYYSEAIATVVHLPRLSKTYIAFKDRGVMLNGKIIHMKDAVVSPKSVFAVSDEYTFHMTDRLDVLTYLRKLPCIVRTVTDIFGYCMVAEGKCIGKFDAAGALWDLAPGYLLIHEAGGKCLYFPMPFPTEDLAGSMLVGNPDFVDEVYSYLVQNLDKKTLPIPSDKL